MSATSATNSGSNSLQLPPVNLTSNENEDKITATLNPKVKNTTLTKLVSGSATGNPRNKCALKPGHSLMDWIRLGDSGEDLSGTRSKILNISSAELAKHNTRQDAWMAIRGKVYNVTRYMDFHPGGVDELMRGVGRDATKLFDEVHAWVNYTQLLQKCYIGPLRFNVKPLPNSTASLLLPPLPPPAKTLTASEILPRFDWIQKTNQITLSIYTRQFCNPGAVIQRKGDTVLLLLIQIAHVTHKFHLNLHDNFQWPPKTAHIFSETGKIEVILAKTEAKLWPSFGILTQSKVDHNVVEFETNYDDFAIVHCKNINHDSFAMCLNGRSDIIFIPPIAYHVTIDVCVNGENVQRSYTPILAKYLHDTISEGTVLPAHSLNFLIKKYDNGLLSTYLQKANVGTTLRISTPRGNLNLNKLLPFKHFILLAAGSGITPFLNLIDHLLRRINNKIELLHLLYFNKTLTDIWCLQQLEQHRATDERFHFMKILSAAESSNWSGAKGRISEELLLQATLKNPLKNCFILICGPTEFNQRTLEILKKLNININDNVHIFQG